ncbi:MAG: gliding motility-associated C-terminal domain-containing protein, partial [Spirochaetes bacterium]|nr:gliding motility-associated C-terminal domain-containing protein [Spirochaetota bacterium]
FNFAFGCSFKFSSRIGKKVTKEQASQARHKTTEFSIDLGARPYHSGFIFETGCTIQIGSKDTSPPEIEYIQKDTYASPNLDGIQDNIAIELNIVDERYIKSWRMEIYDSQGQIIRTIKNKEERRETMKFKDVVKRFFSPKTGIPIPKEVIWDGRDYAGNIVPDGTYQFKFYAMDDNKNENNTSSEGVIYIDTDQPEIQYDSTLDNKRNRVFSPNNDGNKDTIIIDIEIIKNQVENIDFDDYLSPFQPYQLEPPKIQGINHRSMPPAIQKSADNTTDSNQREQIWYVDILDINEKIVKRYTYKDKGPKKIEWDAKDENGNLMPDGIYKIKLHSIDKAGNYWEQFIPNIIINTEPTPIEATILTSIFSPNGDNVKDQIGFKFNIPVKNGIEKWEFEVLTKDKKLVKGFHGEGLPPLEISWDGKDENNQFSKEGFYIGKLIVLYENGNRPFGETPQFEIDVTPPSGSTNLSDQVFSPNGDGKKDEIMISQKTSQEEEWQGIIFNDKDQPVKTFVWKGQPPNQFAWDGKANDGKLLTDSFYYYQIQSTDLAGNSFRSDKKQVKIFTADTPVFITSTYDSFSPNSDGIKDQQTLEIKVNITGDKVKDWQLMIFTDTDSPVFQINKQGKIDPSIIWNGKNDQRQTLPDGNYYAKLEVNFESGNSSSSKTALFNLDNTAPTIEIKNLDTIFSPNNDGNKDQYIILQKGSSEDQWASYIYDQNNKTQWKSFNTGKPTEKVIWTGKDLNGNPAKNGTYRYVIQSEDKAGNKTRAEINSIILKNVHTSAFITLDKDMFSPNKDGKFDEIIMNPFVGQTEGIEIYQIDIFDQKKNIVKTFTGKTNIPEKIIWDGMTNRNTLAEDGVYFTKLTVVYNFGNKPTIESAQFILDNTPPEIDLTLSPQYFSPDNDNVDDELTIGINSYDLSGIKDWNISIKNPKKTRDFISFLGTGKPTQSIVWNGQSKNGNLVESAEDYPVFISAEDKVGNQITKEVDPVRVDILVIKLPDGRLKIKVSNIQFKPNSPEMTDSPKNEQIINLIVKALKKYKLYKITIEGHANKFRENLNEKIAKDLSLKRAETILQTLNSKGIAQNRMTSVGRGFDEPLISLEDAYKIENVEERSEELAKNRRVEFYLDKK